MVLSTSISNSSECPWRSGNIQCQNGSVKFDTGSVPSYITIVSCIFSVLGSFLIIITYCILKDMRTGAQKLITFLALADLISAAGYIVGSANYLTHHNTTDVAACQTFEKLCVAQATITTWSSLVSFCLTVILAFYFFLIIVFKRAQVAGKFIILYNIIAWGGPLIIVIPLLACGKFGYAHFAASNWCFIKVTSQSMDQDWTANLVILMAGKFWEILSYIVVTALYVVITIAMSKAKQQVRNTVMEPRVLHVETRLLAIPVIFILLRMWGTIQYFFSIPASKTIDKTSQCVPQGINTAFIALGILQAIGDGGQGWGNAILYIFLSPVIRQRLLGEWCGRCADKIDDHLNRVADDQATEDLSQQTINSRRKEADSRGKQRHSSHSKPVDVSSDDNGRSESAPLISKKKATGYNIRKYETTTTATCTEGFGTGTDISNAA